MKFFGRLNYREKRIGDLAGVVVSILLPNFYEGSCPKCWDDGAA